MTAGYRKNELVKLEIMINGEKADPLSVVCHRDGAYRIGKALVNKLKKLIPRQMFRVPIQVGRGGEGREGSGRGRGRAGGGHS